MTKFFNGNARLLIKIMGLSFEILDFSFEILGISKISETWIRSRSVIPQK